MYNVHDVVKIRNPFLPHRYWLIEKKIPALSNEREMMILRVRPLKEDGMIDTRYSSIPITDQFIKEYVGGYNKWLKTLKNN